MCTYFEKEFCCIKYFSTAETLIFLNFFLYLELQTYGNALQLLYIFRIIFSLQHGRKYVEVFLSEISEHRDSTALVLK